MVSIYGYTDYREFIKDHIKISKENGSSNMTLGSICGRYKGISKAHLSQVLNSKRNLSAKMIQPLGHSLGLKPRQIDYFENLVQFCQATTVEQKDYYFGKLNRCRPRHVGKLPECRYFELLQSWHCLVVRELVDHPDFSEDPHWISRHLGGSLSIPEARAALKNLYESGQLIRSENGALQVVDPYVETSDEIKSAAIKNYHLSCLELGKKMLQTLDLPQREFASVNLLVSADDFNVIKKRVKEFRDDLLGMQLSDGPRTELCQINIQSFILNGGK